SMPTSRFRLRAVPSIVASASICIFLPCLGTAQAYTLASLHNFCAWTSCGDGSIPRLGVIANTGTVFGMTDGGGKHHAGVGVKLVPNPDTGKYKEHVMNSFCTRAACADGEFPNTSVIMDTSGNLYGTTYQGGHYGAGVVFRVSQNGAFTVLHA